MPLKTMDYETIERLNKRIYQAELDANDLRAWLILLSIGTIGMFVTLLLAIFER